VSEAELAATIRAAAPSIDPELKVLTTEELVDEVAASVADQLAPFRAMRTALQVVAFVAVLSTLLLAGYQRRREHGVLAAVGARPPDLGRVVLAQAGIVGLAAAACSFVLGPLFLWTMLQITPILVGRHNPFDPDLVSLVVAAVLGVLVAVAGGLWPAWRAGRVEVLEALRYE
jgi:putative ABC transport system permease protein